MKVYSGMYVYILIFLTAALANSGKTKSQPSQLHDALQMELNKMQCDSICTPNMCNIWQYLSVWATDFAHEKKQDSSEIKNKRHKYLLSVMKLVLAQELKPSWV
jgi:hypothetical protein